LYSRKYNYTDFFSTGVLNKGFSILTDKRVYFKGKYFYRTGKRFSRRIEERIVDVKDVTGTGFIHKNPIWIKSIVIIFAIAAIISLIVYGFYNPDAETALQQSYYHINPNSLYLPTNAKPLPRYSVLIFTSGFIIAALIFYSLYRANKKSLFEISFAGGGIAFLVRWFKPEEIQAFQCSIRITKDIYEKVK